MAARLWQPGCGRQATGARRESINSRQNGGREKPRERRGIWAWNDECELIIKLLQCHNYDVRIFVFSTLNCPPIITSPFDSATT